MSFDLNPELSQAIHRLQEVIIQDDDEDSELAGMVDISKVSVLFTRSLDHLLLLYAAKNIRTSTDILRRVFDIF